ncbi:MAG: hypothetical protein V7K77_09065 [Nostoc sp.]
MSHDKRLTLLLCETLRERRYRFANASTHFFERMRSLLHCLAVN